MNNHHPIDDFFRSKLQDFELDPPMHLWEGIDKRRKPVPFILKLLAGTAVIAMTWAGWYLTHPSAELNAFPIPLGGQVVTQAPKQFPLQPETVGKATPPTAAIVSNNNPPIAAASSAPTPALLPAIAAMVPPTAPAVSEISTTNARMYPELLVPPIAISYPELLSVAPPELPAVVPPLIDKAAAAWHLHLAAFAGPQGALRRWTPSGAFDEATLARQQQAETPWLSDFRGVHLYAVSPGGFALATGVQYSSVYEKFDYYNPREIRLKISPIEGPAGLLVAQDTVMVTGQRWKTARNYHRTLGIPLLLGFERARGKTSLGVYGGTILHIRTDYRRVMLDPKTGDPMEVTATQPDALRLSWQLHAAWQYRVSPALQVFVAPQLGITSPVSTNSGREQFFTAGLAAGIRTRIY